MTTVYITYRRDSSDHGEIAVFIEGGKPECLEKTFQIEIIQ